MPLATAAKVPAPAWCGCCQFLPSHSPPPSLPLPAASLLPLPCSLPPSPFSRLQPASQVKQLDASFCQQAGAFTGFSAQLPFQGRCCASKPCSPFPPLTQGHLRAIAVTPTMAHRRCFPRRRHGSPRMPSTAPSRPGRSSPPSSHHCPRDASQQLVVVSSHSPPFGFRRCHHRLGLGHFLLFFVSWLCSSVRFRIALVPF